MDSVAAYLKQFDPSYIDEEFISKMTLHRPDIFEDIYIELNNVDVFYDLFRLYKKFGLSYALEWFSFKMNMLKAVSIDSLGNGCLLATSNDIETLTFTKGDEQCQLSLPYKFRRKIIRYSCFIQIGDSLYKLNGDEIEQLKGFTVVGFRLKKYYLCSEDPTISRVLLDTNRFTITPVNEIPLNLCKRPRSRIRMESQTYTETIITDTRNKRNDKTVIRGELLMYYGLDMLRFSYDTSRIHPFVDGQIGNAYGEYYIVARNGVYLLFRSTPLYGTLALLNTFTGECKSYQINDTAEMRYFLDENGTIYYLDRNGKYINHSNSSEALVGVPNEIKEDLFLITSKYLFCMKLSARFVKIYSRASYSLLGFLQTNDVWSVRTYTMTASMYDDTHLRFRNVCFDLNQYNKKRMDIIKDLLPPEILKIIGTFIFF